MTDDDVGNLWEANAEAWTALVRAGCDVCRDLYNSPTFFRMLPSVEGLHGLDIGCGEGHNTRQLAARGARMSAVDIAGTVIGHARQAEADRPLGIHYQVASAKQLPFGDGQFDFVTAFMSLQDMPDQHVAFREAWRVIRPGGFLQFSITHPCFLATKKYWVTDEAGERVALAVSDYFDRPPCGIEEWIFHSTPPELQSRYSKFRIAYFDHTLSEWLNMVVQSGFQLEEFAEPKPDDDVLQAHPRERDARLIPFFLIVRGRKPAHVGANIATGAGAGPRA